MVSSASHRKHMMLVYCVISDFNFDPQVKVVSDIFLSAVAMQPVGL